MIRKTTLVLITSISISLQVFAQKKISKPTKKELLKEWNKLDTFQKKMKEIFPDFGFYAALVYDGKTISTKKNGYASREAKFKMNDKTIHMWGSVSKMFTSVAILQLMERGKLKIDDPVTKFIPELRNTSKDFGGFDSVRVYHLINHTSGLTWKHIQEALDKKYPNVKVKNSWEMTSPLFKHLKLKRKPGAKYAYNNGGYSLLGILIEKVTQQKFTDYIKNNIFKPLGMKTAHYGKTPKRLEKYLGNSYLTTKDSTQTIEFDRSQGIHEGNGGVKATIRDMLKFMNFLRFRTKKQYLKKYDKVLKWDTIKKYYYDLDVNKPSMRSSVQVKLKGAIILRAFGLMYVKNHGSVHSEKLGHSGYIAEYQSLFFVRKDVPFGIIVMTNSSGDRGTPEHIVNQRFVSSLNYFSSTGKINLRFYKWKKALRKLK
ncbi:serine hydrolase domain-containing protein [Microscilla marina]|uniref:serine hydrolase domain-containing protein n=1 Tax=Microscilla marina TaxID=1027 RepID=UPI000309EE2D|nr:serine hydrolase domain-containing protein [Microscilla marina]